MLSRYAYPIQMGLEVVPAITEEDRGHPGQVGTVLGLTHRYTETPFHSYIHSRAGHRH